MAAGIPQVLLTQLEAWLLPMPRHYADIGPRFVWRLSEHVDADLKNEHHWLLAGAFHFGYAATWGAVYSLLQRWRPAQPHVGGPLLAAFGSGWGASLFVPHVSMLIAAWSVVLCIGGWMMVAFGVRMGAERAGVD